MIVCHSWDFFRIMQYIDEALLRLSTTTEMSWGEDDVCDLFDSIHKGYPIGSLLLLDRIESFEVVDGGQRLLSIVSVFLGTPGYQLHFDLRSNKFVNLPHGQQNDSNLFPMSKMSDTIAFITWVQDNDLTPAQEGRVNLLVRGFRDYTIPVYVVDDETEAFEIKSRIDKVVAR